jgi:hypothetical protein
VPRDELEYVVGLIRDPGQCARPLSSIGLVERMPMVTDDQIRVLPHFTFNMDDVGRQDSSDSMDTSCYVPAEREQPPAQVPVPRTGRWITTLTCAPTAAT